MISGTSQKTEFPMHIIAGGLLDNIKTNILAFHALDLTQHHNLQTVPNGLHGKYLNNTVNCPRI
jgi:hypothetical protein